MADKYGMNSLLDLAVSAQDRLLGNHQIERTVQRFLFRRKPE
jgi:hypothetical protein